MKIVPHILERIFFSLGYDSYMACRNVCKTWRELHSAESYQRKAEELLVEKRNNEEKLCQFSKDGNAKEAGNLLSSGVSPNCTRKDMTSLHLAVHKGHEDVVKLLLNVGADTSMANEKGFTPLHWAAIYGYTEVAKLLLDAGADPNKSDHIYEDTPLYDATYRDIAVIVKLLDAGADPNKANRERERPHYNWLSIKTIKM